MTEVNPASQAGMEAWKADVLSLYQRLLPVGFLDRLRERAGICQNNRIYTNLVVMWLMITQRLQGNGTLERAVLELVRGLPASFWPRPCKRLQDWRQNPEALSSHSGAYNNARQSLPVKIVEHSCDRIFEQLTAFVDGKLPSVGRRVFFFDGTSVRLPHTETLHQFYPPGSNQHGESHWPLLRMLVAHDLQTGLAMRPQWGPANGSQAVSEQQLLDVAIDRLPPGSAVAGDANFGVFSVAYAAAQRGHPVVLRLTLARARHLAGEPLRDPIDRRIVWKPSREDRKSHPGLPADACVRGRLIVCQVQPSNQAAPFLLALFTTLEDNQDDVIQLYGKRWNIETDLRSLKSTLQLEQLTSTTPQMVAKELDLAIAAYNLVRAVTCMASLQTGVCPRDYSFTRVRNVLRTFLPLIAACPPGPEAQRLFDRMMYYVGQAKLPKRKRPSYPRAVWAKPHTFPHRKR